jgi:hypothetical protein
MDLNRKAARIGFSCMPDTNTWCWGDEEGNTLHEGVHRYVKAVYVDAWDSRATADDPYIYIVAVTGDLARVSFSGKAVTMCGAKQCDRRLVPCIPTTDRQQRKHELQLNSDVHTPKFVVKIVQTRSNPGKSVITNIRCNFIRISRFYFSKTTQGVSRSVSALQASGLISPAYFLFYMLSKLP